MEHFDLFKQSVRIAKACHSWLSRVNVKDMNKETQQTILKNLRIFAVAFPAACAIPGAGKNYLMLQSMMVGVCTLNTYTKAIIKKIANWE